MISRTVGFALANILVAALLLAGFDVPEEVHKAIEDGVDAFLAALFAINGVAIWILRMRTEQPMRGLFTKRPDYPK